MSEEIKVKNNEFGLDFLEIKVVETIQLVFDEYFKNNNDWKKARRAKQETELTPQSVKDITSKLKAALSRLLEIPNTRIYHSVGNSEFLFDFSLVIIDNEDNLLSLELALESELSSRSKKGLLDDFQKVLVSNAKHRMFLCFGKGNSNYPANINSQIEILQESFDKYQAFSKGESVLALICADYNTGTVYPHLMIK